MKIVKSLSLIMAVVAVVAGATYADFSSTAVSTTNAFTAGTLDVQVSNNNTDFSKSVSGTWTSPANWAPGQEVEGTVHMTNVGTVDSKHVYFGFNSAVVTGGTNGVNLMNKIIVTNLTERFNGVVTADQTAAVAALIGDGIMPLTLKELVDFSNAQSGGYGFYSWDDKSTDAIILQANNQKDYDILFKFKFANDAGNDYQGATASFVLNMNATQNSPTDGMVQI